MKKIQLAALLLTAFTGAFTIACSSSTDPAGSSASDISGSLTGARTCAVRDRYAAADINEFQAVAPSELPEGVSRGDGGALSASYFRVPGVGTVYLVEERRDSRVHGRFYDSSGTLLLQSNEGASGEFEITGPAGGPLACGGAPPTGTADATAPPVTDAASIDPPWVTADASAETP